MVLAALGVPLALIESLPYMMVGMFSPRETHGQLLGKLNVWIGENVDLLGARSPKSCLVPLFQLCRMITRGSICRFSNGVDPRSAFRGECHRQSAMNCGLHVELCK